MMNNSHFDQELKSISSLLNRHGVSRDDLLELMLAIKYNRRYGRIPEQTHLKLVSMFCRSSGEIQEIIHNFRLDTVSNICKSIELKSALFTLNPDDFTSIIHKLSVDGYAALPFRLPRNFCSQILEFSQSCDYSCILKNSDSISRYSISNLSLLRRGTISAHMGEQSILRNPIVFEVVNDPVIVGIARFYLRTAIQLRHVSLWHSFPSFNSEPESELAQLFHFDLDEFRWLKLFIFLTDIDSSNGPHVYIPGTHRTCSKAPDLLRRGYSRITDEDMEKYHPRSTWHEILGQAGTMVFADTRCWHKGMPVINGVRTMLQPEYAPSSFSKQFL